MLEINFVNETQIKMNEYDKLAFKLLNSAVEIIPLKENIELSITYLTDEQAQQMNIEYRNRDYIPDVLSFPTDMSDETIKAIGVNEIGDIFVSFEEAKRKAIKYSHTIEQEMAFIFVHGFLHLLGYDHETNDKDEKVMFDLQNKIWKSNEISYDIKFTEDDYLEEEKHNDKF